MTSPTAASARMHYRHNDAECPMRPENDDEPNEGITILGPDDTQAFFDRLLGDDEDHES